jgi:hypothetical protein
MAGSGQDRGSGRHGVSDDDRGAAEFADQGGDIVRGLLISIGREGGVAVTMTA